MASCKMLQDTATLFVPLGENSEGKMCYDVYLLENVFCRVSSGTGKSKEGLSNADTLMLFAFDTKSTITRDSSAMGVSDALENIFYATRENDPEADVSASVYVVPYDATDYSIPPANSRRVTKAYRRKSGSSRMWHWEVNAE